MTGYKVDEGQIAMRADRDVRNGAVLLTPKLSVPDSEFERQAIPLLRDGHMVAARGQVLNADGSIAWEEDWQLNALGDEGEQNMLSVYLKETAHLLKYLALINGTTTAPTETSTMAYLGGVAGANETRVPAVDGYNRQQVIAADWVDDGLQGGDFRFSAAEKTFGPATGTAWTINHAAMVTAATGQLAGSGKFILFLILSATTTIAVSQSFKYTLRWTQQ